MTNASQPRLFVTGSTGKLDRLVIAELIKRVPANRIVAGVRSVGFRLNALIDRPTTDDRQVAGKTVRDLAQFHPAGA
ncbi:hypothetical protein [Methylocella sp.]|uniref:hypothetical protein n=1 Tax=Methylocella sp. TaxID=1978226 RepID=UPI0037849237